MTSLDLVQLGPDLFRHTDIAHVYIIRSGRSATTIDFGNGSVMADLEAIGVDQITDVVMTHHHRDVAQGLAIAVAAGARVWVPPSERDLLARVDEHWRTRTLDNMYDVRDDRFSLLEPIQIAGTVDEYRTRAYGAVSLLTVPTPGHTYGSESYIADLDGRRIAFTGDLIAAPGKVHSLAATQWSYNGMEGIAAGICSGLDLLDHQPDLLLPAHGEPIDKPLQAVSLLNHRLQDLLNLRVPEWQIEAVRARPFIEVTPHLLWNYTSFSNSYVLLSDSGNALVFDYGYDFWPFITGFEFFNGSDRSSRRPWLQTVAALKRDYGVDRVEVAIPTHYHDDHVAGFNLLREVEGTEVWAPENVAPIFTDPLRFDLPCIWYDPIGVDRVVEFERATQWREYELVSHELPGHTLYAQAIELVVDEQRVLVTGDQQDFGNMSEGLVDFMGYNYRNRFRLGDYERSAELYRRIEPDLLMSGHWPPTKVTPELLDRTLEAGREVARLHRELLPLETVDFGVEGFGARIEPYRTDSQSGEPMTFEVSVTNPFRSRQIVSVGIVAPTGWDVRSVSGQVSVEPLSSAQLSFVVVAPEGLETTRARIGADLTVGDVPFGIQAEALVSTTARVSRS